jgi:hypothetical protein
MEIALELTIEVETGADAEYTFQKISSEAQQGCPTVTRIADVLDDYLQRSFSGASEISM